MNEGEFSILKGYGREKPIRKSLKSVSIVNL